VLENGAVPLNTLEAHVKKWTTDQAARRKAS